MPHLMEQHLLEQIILHLKRTLTFNPGDTSKTFNIPILADTIDENNETFSVTLSSPTNATINDLLGQFTIVDDDTEPTVSLGDATTK